MFPPNLIVESRACCACELASKNRVLQTLADLFSGVGGDLDSKTIYHELWDREKLGPTGLGFGVALPHARMDALERPVGAMVQLKTGVDFGAEDEVPVDLAFALLVPKDATEQHLEILSQLAQRFADEAVRDALRAAGTPADMVEILQNGA